MLRLAGLLLVLSSAGSVAAPVWERTQVINDLRIYSDHLDPDLFYYEPARYVISTINNSPRASYRLFRYMGTTETRDSNTFRVSGVLSVDVEQSNIADRYLLARDSLRGRRAKAMLRPLPVTRFDAQLNYATIGSEGEDLRGSIDATSSGELEPDSSEIDGGHWNKRRFTLAFDPSTAELFWNNFENERLQLSLSYSVLVTGKRINVSNQWEDDERRFADSVPVPLSMKNHAQNFSRIETWQLANRRRTDVIIMCYDFIEPDADDLYRIGVDVRFKTSRNQDYVESLKFTSEEQITEQTVSFRLARDMAEPYYYRVKRIFRSKPVEQTDWIEHTGLLLDVTSYSASR